MKNCGPKYDECLDKYENHDEKDYREVILENLWKTDPKNPRVGQLRRMLFQDALLEYWHYAATWVLMITWGCFLFWRR